MKRLETLAAFTADEAAADGVVSDSAKALIALGNLDSADKESIHERLQALDHPPVTKHECMELCEELRKASHRSQDSSFNNETYRLYADALMEIAMEDPQFERNYLNDRLELDPDNITMLLARGTHDDLTRILAIDPDNLLARSFRNSPEDQEYIRAREGGDALPLPMDMDLNLFDNLRF